MGLGEMWTGPWQQLWLTPNEDLKLETQLFQMYTSIKGLTIWWFHRNSDCLSFHCYAVTGLLSRSVWSLVSKMVFIFLLEERGKRQRKNTLILIRTSSGNYMLLQLKYH